MCPGTCRASLAATIPILMVAGCVDARGSSNLSNGASKFELPALIQISGGQFIMGSDQGDPDERPPHSVEVAPFRLSAYEVTRSAYAHFVAATSRVSPNSCRADLDGDGKWVETPGISWDNPGFEQQDSEPVVCVSWDDAVAYAAWLSRQTGVPYRLPTEAEWEFTARGGLAGTVPWDEARPDPCDNANGADLAAKQTDPGLKVTECDDGFAWTSGVGSFRPNPFGLFDMAGNVWELVADQYCENYDGAPEDGSARTGSCQGDLKVSKGGSWTSNATSLRTTNRSGRERGERINYVGFRLAADK